MSRFLLTLCLITRFCIAQNWVNYNFNNSVHKLYYSTGTNKLFISGAFTKINNVNISGIASYDGVHFDSLGCGINYTTSVVSVKDLDEYKNELYICGGISYMGTTRTKNIAKWNGLRWDSLGTQLNSRVNALKVFNNELYVGGNFWLCGTQPANAIIKYDGTNWIPIGNGIPFNTGGQAIVFDIEAFNNEIYVAGVFYDNMGNEFQLAKFDGTNWHKVLSLNSSLHEINTLKVYNGALYIGGRFLTTSGDPGNLIAKFDGTNWIPLGSGITGLSAATIKEMKVFNNKLYITGEYNDANGNFASSISYWNDTSFCALSLGSQQLTFSTIESYNNIIYTNGNYSTLGTDTVKFLASIIPSSLNFNCSVVNGINENQMSNTIKLYPSPTSSFIHLTDEQNELQNSSIHIKNTLGQTVLSLPFNPEIDVSQLSTGIYFLQIKTEDKRIWNSKFIKEQ